jgi:hypothetical protein
MMQSDSLMHHTKYGRRKIVPTKKKMLLFRRVSLFEAEVQLILAASLLYHLQTKGRRNFGQKTAEMRWI